MVIVAISAGLVQLLREFVAPCWLDPTYPCATSVEAGPIQPSTKHSCWRQLAEDSN